jgi:uncharacterized membrane protein
MIDGESALPPAFRLAAIAILVAVTTVLTRAVQIPPPARGYLNFGEVAIAFTAITLGPFSASLAGGLGTAIADLLIWAPIFLIVHGLQGLLVGLIALVQSSKIVFQGLGGLVGMIVMVGGYLLAGVFLEGAGAALTEVPGNPVQGGAGVVLGIPLAATLLAAYPTVGKWKW